MAAALAMLEDAGEAKPVLITVDTAPARLYPAMDELGRFDQQATRLAAGQLLGEVRRELAGLSGSARRRG